MIQKNRLVDDASRHFTIREASAELRMSEAWVRQKIFRKEIRHLKIGRRVFIPKSTIRQILDGSVVEPRAGGNKRPHGKDHE